MNPHEVAEPILNSPFEEPAHYWYIQEGETPEQREGRRPAVVFPPRDQKTPWTEGPGDYPAALPNPHTVRESHR